MKQEIVAHGFLEHSTNINIRRMKRRDGRRENNERKTDSETDEEGQVWGGNRTYLNVLFRQKSRH